MAHQITITLPDRVYEQLYQKALSERKSVREVAKETLQSATLSEEAKSTDSDTGLSQLVQKSDEELFEIARSQLSLKKRRRFNRLINKHETGEKLSLEEKRGMEKLIEEGDRLTLIKSEAWVLLKGRGHQLPTLEELQAK